MTERQTEKDRQEDILAGKTDTHRQASCIASYIASLMGIFDRIAIAHKRSGSRLQGPALDDWHTCLYMTAA